jgi:predicted GTPase
VRVVALIDGEHYPPVVRFALEELGREHEVLAAAFAGGTEKVDGDDDGQVYGLPVVRSYSAEAAMALAIEAYAPEAIVDLSDEPVVSSAERFRLASVALLHGVGYRGADFAFEPSADEVVTRTPTLGIIGTGKRVGKTAISAHVARHLKAAGRDIVVLAMGRGGPAEPEVIHGEQVELTTEDLLAVAREGVHASSDNYEDAVMSRVTTVGSRRCGGGMGGATYFGNVREAARVADALGKELLVCEGSGAAIPPCTATQRCSSSAPRRARRTSRTTSGRTVSASSTPSSSPAPRSRSHRRRTSRRRAPRSSASVPASPACRSPSAPDRLATSPGAGCSSPARRRVSSSRDSRHTWRRTAGAPSSPRVPTCPTGPRCGVTSPRPRAPSTSSSRS